jgi:hypothetical protein
MVDYVQVMVAAFTVHGGTVLAWAEGGTYGRKGETPE